MEDFSLVVKIEVGSTDSICSSVLSKRERQTGPQQWDPAGSSCRYLRGSGLFCSESWVSHVGNPRCKLQCISEQIDLHTFLGENRRPNKANATKNQRTQTHKGKHGSRKGGAPKHRRRTEGSTSSIGQARLSACFMDTCAGAAPRLEGV